jgi:hypothetical protein
MPYARPNGQPEDIVAHLTTKCGVPIEVADKLVPKRENFEDSPRTSLTPEALETYLRLVKREYSGDRVVSTILLLLPYTGLRIAEICGLRATNVIDKDNGHVIWKFRGKGSKEREVPLWRKARRVFESYMAERPESPWIFPNQTNTNSIRPSVIQEACRHLASLDPSLSKLTAHVLRHTFATMAILNCHDIKRVQAILGHGKKNAIRIPVVMLRYMHPEVANNNASSRVQHSKSNRVDAKSAKPRYTKKSAKDAQENAMKSRKGSRARKNSVLSYPLSNQDMWMGQYAQGPFGGQYPVPVTRRNPAPSRHAARHNPADAVDAEWHGRRALEKLDQVRSLGLTEKEHKMVDAEVAKVRSLLRDPVAHSEQLMEHALKAQGQATVLMKRALGRPWPPSRAKAKHNPAVSFKTKDGRPVLFKSKSNPACRHQWSSRFDLVGGNRENPGVWSDNKGGIVTIEACEKCGRRRKTHIPLRGRGARKVTYHTAAEFGHARNNKGYDTDFSRELSMFDYHAPQFEQTTGPFGVSEAFTHGLQPANRRNPRRRR